MQTQDSYYHFSNKERKKLNVSDMTPYQREYKTTSTTIQHHSTGHSVSGCAHSFEQEVNMDKGSSTVCVLIVALCALVHFGTVFSTVKTGGIFTGEFGFFFFT